jgi:hypothetical protein
MSLPVQCPGCGVKLKAPDAAAGKSLKCPSCAAVVPVPGTASAAEAKPSDAPASGSAKFEVVADEPPARPAADEKQPDHDARPRRRDRDEDDRPRPTGRHGSVAGDDLDERDGDRPRRRRPEGGKSGNKLLLVLLGVAVGVVLVCVGVPTLFLFAIASRSGGTTREDTVAANSPAIRVNANDLFDEYDANEVAADNKYRGKTLLVTGVVREIGKSAFDQPYVAMQNDRNQFMTAVRCLFPRNTSGLATLAKGQELTIRGKCRGFSIRTVQLEDCKLE